MHAPIALFVYNRLWHTQRTVQALQMNHLANASDLFIYSDGPKGPASAAIVRDVRAYVRTIDGFRTVNIIERSENFGLARSIIDGVTALAEQYGRVIVMEDDVVTSPHFLEYMNSALERYKEEEKVMQVAGHMFPVELQLDDDALFLPFISSWGWATWSRAWRHFDPRGSGYELLAGDSRLRRQFDLGGHYRYFRMLRAQREGRTESWAIRWYLSVFLRGGLALYPRRTLVKNVGFDGTGVNCSVSGFLQDELDATFRVARLPHRIEVSSVMQTVVAGIPARKLSIASILNRALRLSKAQTVKF